MRGSRTRIRGLCVATGWYLLWPLVVTGCALVYLRLRERIAATGELSGRP